MRTMPPRFPERFQWRAWAANPEGITGEELLAFVDDDLFPALKNLRMTGHSGDRRRVVRDLFEDAYNYMKSGQLMRQVVNKINEGRLQQLERTPAFWRHLRTNLERPAIGGQCRRVLHAPCRHRLHGRPRRPHTWRDPVRPRLRHRRLLDLRAAPHARALCEAARGRADHAGRVARGGEEAVAAHALRHQQLLHGIEAPSFVRHDNTLARPYIGWGQQDRVDIVLTNPPFGGKEEDGIESNFPQHFRTRETADLFLALIIRLLKPGGRAAVVLPDGSLFGEGVKTRLKEHLMEECNLHTIVRLPNSVFRPYASIGTNLLFFEKGEPTGDIWFYEHRVPEGQKGLFHDSADPVRAFAGVHRLVGRTRNVRAGRRPNAPGV